MIKILHWVDTQLWKEKKCLKTKFQDLKNSTADPFIEIAYSLISINIPYNEKKYIQYMYLFNICNTNFSYTGQYHAFFSEKRKHQNNEINDNFLKK